jgi:hypothetical protein
MEFEAEENLGRWEETGFVPDGGQWDGEIQFVYNLGMERPGSFGMMVLGAATALIFSFARFILHDEWVWVPKAENWGPTWYFILVGTVFFAVGLFDLLRQKKG